MQKKLTTEEKEGFSLRVKIAEFEVELSGNHKDVMKTIQNLPDLITNLNKAFEKVKPKTVATITVKTADETKAAQTTETQVQNYPKIATPKDPEDAILQILESEWGKWRPRTPEELQGALNANKFNYNERTFTSTLNKLAEKHLVRRWNTNSGFVYILADEKQLSLDEENKK